MQSSALRGRLLGVLPHAATFGGLFLGFLGLLCAWEGKILASGVVILIAAVLDGLDGRIARSMGVSSDLGRELDSLSDLVSFGVAPTFLMASCGLLSLGVPGVLAMFLFIACGAYRLARFNLEPASSEGGFSGLPIPMAGGFLASLAILKTDGSAWLLSPEIPLGSMLVLAALMVSKVPFPSLKHMKMRHLLSWRAFAIGVGLVGWGLLWPKALPLLLFGGYPVLSLGRLAFKNLNSQTKRARILRFEDRSKGSALNRPKTDSPNPGKRHGFKLIRLRKDEGRGA